MQNPTPPRRAPSTPLGSPVGALSRPWPAPSTESSRFFDTRLLFSPEITGSRVGPAAQARCRLGKADAVALLCGVRPFIRVPIPRLSVPQDPGRGACASVGWRGWGGAAVAPFCSVPLFILSSRCGGKRRGSAPRAYGPCGGGTPRGLTRAATAKRFAFVTFPEFDQFLDDPRCKRADPVRL